MRLRALLGRVEHPNDELGSTAAAHEVLGDVEPEPSVPAGVVANVPPAKIHLRMPALPLRQWMEGRAGRAGRQGWCETSR